MAHIVNWLLVGAGDIARKRVAPALREVEGSRILALCDPDGQRATELARDFGIETVYQDYGEALERSDADAVYIATPVGLHIPMTFEALKSGRHVLVEKPLGLTYEDVQPALEAEADSGLVSGCAYFRRFYPVYRRTAEMLAQGVFGKVVHVRLSYFSWFNPAPEDPKYWRVVRSRSGGGPLSDMGTHMFDVLIGLLGLPEKVSAMTAAQDRDWDVEDGSAILMRLPGGALVTAGIHWNSKTWNHAFEIIGTEARALWQPYDSGKMTLTIGRETEEIDLPCAGNVHRPLIEDFVAAIREGRAPAVTLAEAAKTNRLLDAVYRSAREGREAEV
ncbi:MAG: Gfo/Idh/MocA family protein [Candidatus Latescibacterota bacterium]